MLHWAAAASNTRSFMFSPAGVGSVQRSRPPKLRGRLSLEKKELKIGPCKMRISCFHASDTDERTTCAICIADRSQVPSVPHEMLTLFTTLTYCAESARTFENKAHMGGGRGPGASEHTETAALDPQTEQPTFLIRPWEDQGNGGPDLPLIIVLFSFSVLTCKTVIQLRWCSAERC